VIKGACLSSRSDRTELNLSISGCRVLGGLVIRSDDSMFSQKVAISILLRRRNEWVARGGGGGGRTFRIVKMGK
jgi:hypothetical protein